MPIILIEDNIILNKKTNDKLKNKVSIIDSTIDDDDTIRRDIPGLKIAKHTIGTNYRTDNKKKSGSISTKEAERIINHAKYDTNPNSTFNTIFDADVIGDIKQKLSQKRTSVKPSIPVKDNNKTATKTSQVNAVSEVKPNNVSENICKTIKITAEQLKRINNLNN